MRRPADQAKLLFLYLLRSSAALATESKMGVAASASASAAATSSTSLAAAAANGCVSSAGAVAGAAAASSSPSPPCASPLAGHIALRVARPADVPQIQRCNLATLPENYSANFYAQHMRQWPELALVAEHVPDGGTSRTTAHNNGHSHPPSPRRMAQMRSFGMGGFIHDEEVLQQGEEEEQEDPPRIVGYVLGKVDRGVVVRDYPPDAFDEPSSFGSAAGGPSIRDRVAQRSSLMRIMGDDVGSSGGDSSFLWGRSRVRRENLGHVTSLAVLPDFRRRGLAAELMEQLHRHMRCPPYGADAVGLHVRVSNRAATRLYSGDNDGGNGGGSAGMGYRVADVIRGYYQDGEDAYFMRKEFAEEEDAARAAAAAAGGDARMMSPPSDGGSGNGGGRVGRVLDRLRVVGGGSPGGGRTALRMSSWEEGVGGGAGSEEYRLPRYIPLAPDAETSSTKRVGENPMKADIDVAVNVECQIEVEDEEEQVMSGAA